MKGKISRIAFGGSGIAKNDGLVIFVPFAAPEDNLTIEITKQKKTHGFGKILSIDEPSPYRIKPICPYFGECGGCQFQHLEYSKQLEIKYLFVKEALERIGKISCEVSPVVPAEKAWAYRRHITLHLTPFERGFQAGYVGIDHVSPLVVKSCDIFIDSKQPLLIELQSYLKECNNNGINEAHVRILKASEHTFLLAFTFFPALPENYSSFCKNLHQKIPSCVGVVIKSPREVHSYGQTTASFTIDDIKFTYSPYGFVQNHPQQSANIYHEIVKIISPNSKKVLDLYCGIGVSSLLLARTGREILGIDSNKDCIYLAERNAQENGIQKAVFTAEKVEKSLEKHLKEFAPDTIIVNPPRIGISKEVLDILLEYKPKEILYTSCNPTTLARDLHRLCDVGYQIALCKPYDMFPQTTHVETLVQLKRGNDTTL
ncbi:MAG: 23S rRNA (uracil(1939)-C(5))-methyltransferase RlmD [Chlamydiae bacterium]|nr:23S rRNA (uracil(1939)-C(5))-methyltransferase RlmD [Chlamydiota bacterium]